MYRTRLLALILSTASASPCLALPVHRSGEVVAPNDNRHAAGRLARGVLTVRLEARRGTWYPEGVEGKGLDVAAWAEEGKPLQDPGPLLRVPLGTVVQATLRNALDKPLRVYGFGNARGRGDSLVIEPGATRDVAFTAREAGTFWYSAIMTPGPLEARTTDDSQLNGAIVVDAPNANTGVKPANDRVFVLSWWFTLDSTSRTGLGTGTMAINGLAWPHTERIDITQGDSARWHVVNLTGADHPMHLHGFYFRMDSKSDGDGTRDTLYALANQRLAVTEVVLPAQTMTLSWYPDRTGNWIYHCHYASHVSELASLDDNRGDFDMHAAMAHSPIMQASMKTGGAAGGMSMAHQMFGLVLGIRVAPKPGVLAVSHRGRAERAVRVTIRERDNVYGKGTGYAFVLGGSPEESQPDALPVPGRPIVLTRGEPVAITIVNHAKAPASIHWHGIELESYADGVPNWSGAGQNVLPSVAPNDSVTVHYTAPRAGTFMYHSHFAEMHQINSGLYGAILVLEPGEKFDPERDRVFFVGNAGPTSNVIAGPFAPLLLNGSETPAPLQLRAGVSYRFRFLNLSDDLPTILTLDDGGHPTTWRALAKDGATLPPSQSHDMPAVLVFDPGEIYDFRFTPQKAGDLSLTFGHLNIPGAGFPEFKPVPVAVHVTP